MIKRIITMAIALAVTAICMVNSATAQTGHSRTVTAWLSTYTYWNNSPPGYGIEYAHNYGYHTVHNSACCRAGGTYANPIAFASQSNQLAPGARIYIPMFRRYFIKEDYCSSCYRNRWQFDLWVGGVPLWQEHDQSARNMVNLWRTAQVIINPARGLPVSKGLFRKVQVSS